jgi:ankyrin repeat protein
METTFVFILFVAALAGFKEDANRFLLLSHATWDDVRLGAVVKDIQHGPKQRTRLMFAAQAGKVNRMRWLLARGARPELKDADGMTALDHACKAGQLEAVQVLVAHGAAINPSVANYTPLYVACQYGHWKVAMWLLQQGANASAVCFGGETPLHVACYGGCPTTVKELLINGAQVDAVTSDGYNPLYIASQCGHLESVVLLLDAGAVVNPENLLLNPSPLFLACKEGHLDVAIVLVARGANVNRGYMGIYENGELWGQNPLNAAHLCEISYEKRQLISEFLIEHGGVTWVADN